MHTHALILSFFLLLLLKVKSLPSGSSHFIKDNPHSCPEAKPGWVPQNFHRSLTDVLSSRRFVILILSCCHCEEE